MRLESALEIAATLAYQLDGNLIPSSFSFTDHSQSNLSSPLNPRELPHVGIGVSLGRSAQDVRIAVRAWTREDVEHFESLAQSELSLPESELDIVITGEIYATPPAALPPTSNQLRQRRRPVHPGVSIGHAKVTAGTLGALVEVENGGSIELHMLSNNHVFANSVSISNPTAAALRDPILQQGPMDGGTPPPVGLLSRYVPLQTRGNYVDAALASCDSAVEWDPEVPWIGLVAGTTEPFHRTEVQKVGRTTDHTRGNITAYPLRSLPVRYGTEVFRFDDVVEVKGQREAFSMPGDSGALVVDSNNLCVGLLFAGTPNVTYVNPIARVKAALGFRCIKGG